MRRKEGTRNETWSVQSTTGQGDEAGGPWIWRGIFGGQMETPNFRHQIYQISGPQNPPTPPPPPCIRGPCTCCVSGPGISFSPPPPLSHTTEGCTSIVAKSSASLPQGPRAVVKGRQKKCIFFRQPMHVILGERRAFAAFQQAMAGPRQGRRLHPRMGILSQHPQSHSFRGGTTGALNPREPRIFWFFGFLILSWKVFSGPDSRESVGAEWD